MAKEFFDQAAVTMTDSHKFGVGLGAGNAMKTITYAALKALLTAISWTFSGVITFGQDIVMGTNKITGLGDGTSAQDAVTKSQMETADGLRLALAGGTMGGAIAMSTYKITGLGNGADPQDAVTKSQLDTKQTKATGFTEDMIVSVDSSGFIKESIYKQNRTINALNIPELTAAPADSGDGMGNDGDFGFYGDYFYRKDSVQGWLRSSRYETF